MDNCRENCPKCLLGQMTDKYKPRNIQIPGRPAYDVLNKFRSTPLKDHYKIMIIGMNPGKEEDRMDIPFVGKAGEFLSEFMTRADLPFEDVFITNLVRCITPNNRNPSASEIKSCIPYVYEEIKKYNPKVIMLLGNVALKLFNIRDGGISKCRGKIFTKRLPDWPEGPEFQIIPSYHPATFVYRDNKKQKELAISDYILAKEVATGETTKTTFYQAKYKVCETIKDVEDAVKVLDEAGIYGVDTESPDLDFMNAPLMLLQASAGIGQTFLFPFYSHDSNSTGEWKLKPYWNNLDRKEIESILRNLFLKEKNKCILHNAKYDINVIKRWLNIDITNEIYDTQILHHLIYEYPPHGLKDLADMEFHVGDWEGPVREIVGGEEGDSNLTWDNVPDEKLWPYGANDAELTRRLFDPYWEIIKSKPHLLKLYQEESLPAIHALKKAEWMGNKIDLEKVDEMEVLYNQKLDFFLQECRQLAGKPDLNPQSPDQIVSVLTTLSTPENRILEKITDKTKSKGFSTGKAILLEIDHPFAEKVLEYRKYRKLISTYVDRIREDIDENNRVRYQFNLAGTASARISCRLLHQIPRIDKESVKNDEVILRQIFIEDEGFDLVYADFDQLELWVFAYKAAVKELIRVLESGDDIHKYTAAAALSVPIEEISDFNRSNVGKRLNFGTIYGSSGQNVSTGEFENPKTKRHEKIGKERAEKFIHNFNKKYPEINEYKTDLINVTLANNCVYRTEFGREIHVPELTSGDDYRVKKIERELLNKSIQSPAGALAIRTINVLDKILDEYGYGIETIRLINTVHDSVLYGVKKDKTEWFRKTLKEVAERNIPELFNKKFGIKVGVGKNWLEAELNAK